MTPSWHSRYTVPVFVRVIPDAVLLRCFCPFFSGMMRTAESGGVCCYVVNVSVLPCLHICRHGVTSLPVSTHCFPHITVKWWIGRSAHEEALPAEMFPLTWLDLRWHSVKIWRQHVAVWRLSPAHEENCIRTRLIQFNLRCVLRQRSWGKQIIDLPKSKEEKPIL